MTESSRLLAEARDLLRAALGESLVALVAHGSLVAGDFDEAASDLDLLAVIRDALSERELRALRDLHAASPRLDVVYAPAAVVRDCLTREGAGWAGDADGLRPATIGRHHVMSLYVARRSGLSLHGQPPAELIGPLTPQDFVDCARRHAEEWDAWVQEMISPAAQSYAVLTLCRTLHAVREGAPASKRQGSAWARLELPAWADLIDRAERRALGAGSHDETVRFVLEARRLILEAR